MSKKYSLSEKLQSTKPEDMTVCKAFARAVISSDEDDHNKTETLNEKSDPTTFVDLEATKGWKPGDYCMAKYEDEGHYEAMIVSIDHGSAKVVFPDFDEEEVIDCDLEDIYPNEFWTNGENEIDCQFVDWQVGDTCMTSFADGNFYKAIVKKKLSNQRFMISFIDYDEDELYEKHLSDLYQGSTEVTRSENSCKKSPNRGIPPPSPILPSLDDLPDLPGSFDKEALSNMIMSWYMAGYHTGYYRALAVSKQK